MVEFNKFGSSRLSIISGAVQGFGAGTQTVATAQSYYTARVRHQNRTGKRVGQLAAVFANYGPNAGNEAKHANSIQVQCAIEFKGTAADQSTARSQLDFNGSQTPVIERGAILQSAPIDGEIIEPGAFFFERTAVTVLTDGQTFQRGQVPLGSTSQWGQDTGEGVQATANRVADGTGDISNNLSSCYSASLILGQLEDGSVAPSLAIIGDSISVGTDDGFYGPNAGGWAVRAFANYPHVKLAIAGEKLVDFIDPKKSYSRIRLASYATHVLDAYGRNDVGAGRTAAQIKADILTNAYRFMARGQTYDKATILPAPSSTDGWFTVANQTKEAADAVRVEVNQWIRDTSTSGFAAQAAAAVASIPGRGTARALDICAGVECNSSGVLTADGGYLLGAQSAKLATGTATAGAVGSITDSAKAWTTNQLKGKSLYIASGNGAGQSRAIAYNSATQLFVAANFSPAPDATSQYEVFAALGMTTAVHPHTTLFELVAASINADQMMS